MLRKAALTVAVAVGFCLIQTRPTQAMAHVTPIILYCSVAFVTYLFVFWRMFKETFNNHHDWKRGLEAHSRINVDHPTNFEVTADFSAVDDELLAFADDHTCFGPLKSSQHALQGEMTECCKEMRNAQLALKGTGPSENSSDPENDAFQIQIEGVPSRCKPLLPWVDAEHLVHSDCGPQCIEYKQLPRTEYFETRILFESLASGDDWPIDQSLPQ